MFRFSHVMCGKALVVAEIVNGKVSPATLSAITAANKSAPSLR